MALDYHRCLDFPFLLRVEVGPENESKAERGYLGKVISQ